MVKVHVTAKAKIDLNGIWEFTYQNWSKVQADKYFLGIQNQFLTIAKNPTSGKNYDFIYPNLYGRNYKSHVILYEVQGSNEIEVIRILHERMDIPNRLIDK